MELEVQGGPLDPPGIWTSFVLCSGRMNGHQQLQAHPSWMYLSSGSEVIAGLALLALLFPEHTRPSQGSTAWQWTGLVLGTGWAQGRACEVYHSDPWHPVFPGSGLPTASPQTLSFLALVHRNTGLQSLLLMG